MALTKSAEATVDEWAVTANTAIRTGTEIDVSDAYEATLNIKAALAEAVASTGQPEIIVQTTGKTSPATEDWTNAIRFIGPVGISVTPLALGATEPAAETVIACTNPETAGIDNDGKFKFIKNTTPANCEIIYQVSNSGDADDTITILDGLANEQTAAASLILDIDDPRDEVVAQWNITMNCLSINRIRVIYNADYDTDGPDVCTFCSYSKTTAV